MARFIGRAMAARGAHQVLAPIWDITRDPRWGRIEETYGEDPYLVTAFGLAYTRGVQGEGVVATGKHLVGHGLPEGGMNRAPAHIGERELRDQFLAPFEAAVREGGIRSMMHAYEDIDGVPCVVSRELLTGILREEWGFDGVVVSDYDGVALVVDHHGLVRDLGEAAARSLEAGLDIELPSTTGFGAPLAAAVASGRVPVAVVDTAVERVLRQKLELGLFEAWQVDEDAAEQPADAERALARESAAASLVLLENDGTLPLRPDLRRVAVIGPSADDPRALLGDYAHVVHIQTLMEMRDRQNVFDIPVPDTLDIADELAAIVSVRAAARDAPGPGRDARPCARLRRCWTAMTRRSRRRRRWPRRRSSPSSWSASAPGSRMTRPWARRATGWTWACPGARASCWTPCSRPAPRGAGRARRPAAGHPRCRRALRRDPDGLGARRGGRGRDRGDARRRPQPGRQAAGDRAAARGPGADVLRPQAVRWTERLEDRLRRRAVEAAVGVRAWPELHPVRAVGPRARPRGAGAGRGGRDLRDGPQHGRARRR